MATCRACNAQFNPVEGPRGLSELCGNCASVSRYDSARATDKLIEVLVNRMTSKASERPLVERWEEALGQHDFGQGLGLGLSEGRRIEHLRSVATQRFNDYICDGYGFSEAVGLVLGGKMFRGDQRHRDLEELLGIDRDPEDEE